jgi:WD40 repeat protein
LEIVAPTTLLLERSVSCQSIAFVKSGKYLVTITNDQNHTVAVLNWRSGTVLIDAKSGPSLPYAILEHESAQVRSEVGGGKLSIVSYGKRHLRFWTYEERGKSLLSSSTSTPSDVLCVVAIPKIRMVAAGQGDGTMTFWFQNIKRGGGGGGAKRGERGGEESSSESIELTTRGVLISTYGPLSNGAPVTAIAICRDASKSTGSSSKKEEGDSGEEKRTSELWTHESTTIVATGQSDGAVRLHAVL